MLLIDLVLLFFTCILSLKVLTAFTYSKLRHVPGPWYTIVTSFPLTLSSLTGRKVFFIHKLHQKYGAIVRVSPDTVAVADLESTLKIHKHGSDFFKTEWYSNMTPSDRDGIFAIRDPEAHNERKRLFSRAFSKSSIRSHWESTVVEKVKLATGGILREVRDTGAADIMKWFMFFATDVSGHLMFGESFNMLEMGKKNRYILVMEKMLMGTAIKVDLPLIAPILELLPFKATRDLFKGGDLLYSYSKKAIENAKIVGTNTNIFAQMIQEASSGSETIDDLDVQYEAGNLTIAGSDTTGITLTYLTWVILKEPQLRSKLQEEVGKLEDGFKDAHLEALPLLNATIAEGLRLYGAVPGPMPRYVPSSGTTLAGVFIPGGITVNTQNWTLHRDPQLFENPEVFDPYRFLANETNPWTSISSTATPEALMPFGIGPRACIGIHLAFMELRYGVAYFLRECQSLELSETTTAESMKPENYFLIQPKAHKCMVVSGE